MSTNAAFAGPVPGGRADSGSGLAEADLAGVTDAAGELERWYVEQRAWPVRRDDHGRLWLEAGTDFDVVEVPEGAGRRALRRLIGYGQAALAPGPVALCEPVASGPSLAEPAASGGAPSPTTPAAALSRNPVPLKNPLSPNAPSSNALSPNPVSPDPVSTDTTRCCFFVAPGARDDLPELLDWLDWGGIDLGMRAYGAGDSIPAPAADRWLHDPLAVPPEVIALLATIAESCSRYALTRRAR